MFVRIRILLAGLITGLALASCGGGGGQVAEGGIGGTGISTGTVTGFGSVYVNGVKYDTTNTSFSIDNGIGSETDLDIGMVVTVKGEINTDGVTGTATSIKFEDLLEGPISAKGADTLTIMDHTIRVNTNTKYQGITDISTLQVDDVVEVSGYYDESFNVIATHIELTSETNHEVTGEVTGISLPQVTLNGVLTVNGIGSVSMGDYIEVFGTYNAGVFTASGFESRTPGFDIDDSDDAELEGVALSACIDPLPCTILVNGQSVEINSSTQFDTGTHLDVIEGTLIEVEGTLVNGVLIADEIEFEYASEVKAEINIITDNTGTKTISLTNINGLSVEINETTTDFEFKNYDTIAEGDFVKLKGNMDGTTLIVSRVEEGSFPEVELEGVVDNSNSMTETITVMGVTISTSGLTLILDDGSDTGQTLSSMQFYSYLDKNEANVEIKGILSAPGGGGTITWTEVELDL